MKALISPNEPVYSYNRALLGQRIAQVSDFDFPVASPLFWLDCPDECVADKWYYSDSDGQLYIKPMPPEPEQEVNTP